MVNIIVGDSSVLALVARYGLVFVVTRFWVEGDDVPSICATVRVSVCSEQHFRGFVRLCKVDCRHEGMLQLPDAVRGTKGCMNRLTQFLLTEKTWNVAKGTEEDIDD